MDLPSRSKDGSCETSVPVGELLIDCLVTRKDRSTVGLEELADKELGSRALLSEGGRIVVPCQLMPCTELFTVGPSPDGLVGLKALTQEEFLIIWMQGECLGIDYFLGIFGCQAEEVVSAFILVVPRVVGCRVDAMVLPVCTLIEHEPGSKCKHYILVDVDTAVGVELGIGGAVCSCEFKIFHDLVEYEFPVVTLSEKGEGILSLDNVLEPRNIGECTDPGEISICPPEPAYTFVMVVGLLVDVALGPLHVVQHVVDPSDS